MPVELNAYDYTLPHDLIATEPASPRDSARLFVYDTEHDTVTFDTFASLTKYVPKHAVMVFNDTKVIPARLHLKKVTGGRVEVLLSINEMREGDTEVKGIVDKRIEPGAELFFENGEYLRVIRQEEQYFFFKPSVSLPALIPLLLREGKTPIPPYIKHTPLGETALRARYQSVLAREGTSIAAPTASLHFTSGVLDSLREHGIDRTVVTLHVGSGTFAPLRESHFTENKLFTEYCAITEETARLLNSALAIKRPIIAVGSTSMRTLESFTNNHTVLSGEKGTSLFIHPPYEFQIASGLITNFHVPRSSLMLMVDAFLEHKGAKRRILDLYDIAIKEKFRFYSFGDAMLIL